jgi:hypothetical protein
MTRLHMTVEAALFGPYETEMVAVCGNDRRRTKRLTEDWTKVDCPTCLRLLGIEATEPEMLTVCAPDPLERKAA